MNRELFSKILHEDSKCQSYKIQILQNLRRIHVGLSDNVNFEDLNYTAYLQLLIDHYFTFPHYLTHRSKIRFLRISFILLTVHYYIMVFPRRPYYEKHIYIPFSIKICPNNKCILHNISVFVKVSM